MTRYMAAARIDERGRISGGKDGDQTGSEVMVQTYSNFGIDTVLRFTGEGALHVRNRIVRAAVGLAANNNIGYNQLRRTTSFSEVRDGGWTLACIPKVGLCATDCSELVAICVNVGLQREAVPSWNYTGNEAANLKKVGFSDVTGAVNRSTGEGLKAGDILLKTSGHTAVYVGTSKKGSRYVKTYEVVRRRGLYRKPKADRKKLVAKLAVGDIVEYQHKREGRWRRVRCEGGVGWVHIGAPVRALKVREYE